jgi:hypothetical protein
LVEVTGRDLDVKGKVVYGRRLLAGVKELTSFYLRSEMAAAAVGSISAVLCVEADVS